jgi:hypothetical protein
MSNSAGIYGQGPIYHVCLTICALNAQSDAFHLHCGRFKLIHEISKYDLSIFNLLFVQVYKLNRSC